MICWKRLIGCMKIKETLFCQLTNTEKDKEIFEKAGEIIRAGGLVAFPTETVYGLGGDAMNVSAAKEIYAAKGRPSDNPLIVHICRKEDLFLAAKDVGEKARILTEAFWPGPLTIILPKNEMIPASTTGGLDTVAVRFPANEAAVAFIKASGRLIAAPSANTSGRPSTTKALHVKEDLDGKIDMIIDGGAVEIGLESTIVDMTENIPVILRPGYITKGMLEAVIGPVLTDPGLLEEDSKKPPKAPGMKYRHYAPKAALRIVSGNSADVIKKINELCRQAEKEGKRTGVIAAEETYDLYDADVVVSAGGRTDSLSIASRLYDILRSFDSSAVDVIYSECFEDNDLGQAIMNRLLKAAGHHIVRLGG